MKVFIDMDCVIADFYASDLFCSETIKQYNSPVIYQKGFFQNLPVMDGAYKAVRELLRLEGVEVYILTQPLANSPHSYSEKARWIGMHFPELFGSIIMTQNKELCSGKGRILIDDNYEKWHNKWVKGGGTFLHFPVDCNSKEQWAEIVQQIREIVE